MKKLPNVKRRGVGSETEEWVRVAPLLEDAAIPMAVEPRVEGLDLTEWATKNLGYLDELLAKHHALLFRGFESGGIEGFERFVDSTSQTERLAYRDRSTPRGSHGDRIYDATVYPADQRINLHNEGTYWITWARKIYFACITNAETGGQTPIADVHRVYERIDPAVRAEFEARGILYVRNYNHGFGLTWQDVYQTEEPTEVEAYCRDNRIELEWKEGGRLRTKQRRPAVRMHPEQGLPLWFNHGAFFHVSALDPAMRDTFLAELGEDELPYNTYYGDGAPIDPEVVRHVLDAYEAEKVVFRWKEGDVALYDNMRIAHAREPYTGERLTLVAMTEPYSGPES
jgi:alpha-ketoglutarate-dependent taurine dioxygenase